MQKCYNTTPRSSRRLSASVLASHRGSHTGEAVVCTCSHREGTACCRCLSRWLNVCGGSLDRASVCVPGAVGINCCWAHSRRVRTAWPFREQAFLLAGFEHVQAVHVKASWLEKHLPGGGGPSLAVAAGPRFACSRKSLLVRYIFFFWKHIFQNIMCSVLPCMHAWLMTSVTNLKLTKDSRRIYCWIWSTVKKKKKKEKFLTTSQCLNMILTQMKETRFQDMNF